MYIKIETSIKRGREEITGTSLTEKWEESGLVRGKGTYLCKDQESVKGLCREHGLSFPALARELPMNTGWGK